MKLNEYLQANMEPYKPLLLNDRNEKGISIGNYMKLMKMNASRLISKSVESPIHPLTTRPTLDIVKNSYNLPQIQHLVVENQVLQAKLKEEQNKAQLATNKYLYLQMMYKKMEYEQLIKQEQQKPQLPIIDTQREFNKTIKLKNTNDEQLSESIGESKGYIRNRIKSLANQAKEETPKVYKVKYYQNKKVLSPEEVAAEVQKMKERQRIEEEKEKKLQNLWKKFLRCHLVILIVIRWSENIRKKRKEKEKQQQEQNKKAKLLFKEIKKYTQVQSQDIIKNWVSKITLRIYQGMIGEEMKKVFSQNFNPNQVENQEIQKKWLIYFLILFFKNVEQHTRQDSMPDFLCFMMTLQLYSYQNKTASLYIVKRTTYLNGNVFSLSEKEIQMITSEFILFSIIIPEIINQDQKQKYFNQQHQTQCRQIFLHIFSLLQILFISTFCDLPEIKQTNKIKVIQKRIIQNQQTMELKFEQDDQIDLSQAIVVGLEKKQKYEKLYKQNTEVLDDLKRFLEIILENISGNAFI
ncbi:unnamed protein product [Paramecium primaurelia]|uniref:Uncharacterized protein n=1 Tax=Paramecium primaurelia TaxID=5886 RepID=A0A8S1PK45_PARPR|nr:unnamed protein product [Paramecium primaurelia]